MINQKLVIPKGFSIKNMIKALILKSVSFEPYNRAYRRYKAKQQLRDFKKMFNKTNNSVKNLIISENMGYRSYETESRNKPYINTNKRGK